MKKLIILIFLFCCRVGIVYSDSVIFLGEFYLVFPSAHTSAFEPKVPVGFDETFVSFKIGAYSAYTVVEDKEEIVDTCVAVEDTLLLLPEITDLTTNAQARLLSDPIPVEPVDPIEPEKLIRFEFVRFEDSGGQINSISCHYGPSHVSFKPNYTNAIIEGKVVIHYNTVYLNENGQIHSDGSYTERRCERTMKFFYSQQPYVALEAGTIPAVQYFSEGATSCKLEGCEAKGGRGSYYYAWQQYTSGGWKSIGNAYKKDYTVNAPAENMYFRRMVSSGTQTAYSNVCILKKDVFGNRNYILKTTALKNESTDPEDYYRSTITYYDGLGRKAQEIGIEAAPDGSDLIMPVYYDELGREDARTYLPYALAANKGRYDLEALGHQSSFYAALYPGEGAYTYAEKKYEASPLERVLYSYNTGKIFREKDKKTIYRYATNAANEVFRFMVNNDGSFKVEGYYPAHSLHKTVITDADGRTSESFTDISGKVVLLRQIGEGSDKADTYSVFDDQGRVAAVISPEGSALLSSGLTVGRTHIIATQYSYLYTYDKYDRLIGRKLPGMSEEYSVYDKGNRVVMWQNGNLRASNRWKLNRYDVLGRLTEVKLISHTSARSALQNLFDTGNTNSLYLTSGILLQECAYDSYRLLSPTLFASDDSSVPLLPDKIPIIEKENSKSLTAPKGLLTWEKLAIMENDNTVSHYIEKAYTYDKEGRILEVKEKNPEELTSTLSKAYDFVGNEIQVQEQSAAETTVTSILRTTNTYDRQGRLLSTETVLNGEGKGQLEYQYDRLGQLSKRVYGQTACTESFTYTLQGWLDSRVSAPFSMYLRYGQPSKSGSTAAYTGNISEWEWTQGSGNSFTYAIDYDVYGRFKGARSFSGNTLDNRNTEQEITYDLNGNIKTLRRTGTTAAVVDNLVYTYTGNQLTALAENAAPVSGDIYARGNNVAGAYTYDADGNLQTDTRQGLNYQYNYLNLLRQVTSANNLKAAYRYAYNGNKVGVKGADGRGWDYRGSFVYTRNGSSLTLESALFGGGRIVSGTSGYEVYYYLTDHLGSVRAVVDADGKVRERNDYYLFGTRQLKENYPQLAVNREKFSGKECQTVGNLGLLDYGARMYDASLGKWMTVDPMAEKNYALTPYHYCGNNPVTRVDADGMLDDWYASGSGALLWLDRQDKQVVLNGETFSNIGTSVSVGQIDGSYINYYQNVPISISNVPKSASFRVLNDPSLSAQLLNRRSPLSLKSQVGLMQSLVNKGREDFIHHPVTQGVMNAAVFLTTGGIEGIVALGNIGKFFVKPAASQLTRVFWSGGVLEEAMNFAKANGMTTLEMTRAGRNLSELTKNMSWEEAKPLWERLSATYAKGAKGPVHVFQNAKNGISIESVWSTVEYPILNGKNPIIYHNVIPK